MLENRISAARSLSIVVCTYDRRTLLLETLNRIDELGYFDDYNVIVVENTDSAEKRIETAELCRARYPKITVIESETPGLSRARNLGLAATNSDIVAYLDDDALPCEGWAEAIVSSFDTPSVVYAGGPIDPLWEGEPPQWMPPELYGAFTVLDLGNVDRLLAPTEFIYGANMAFRSRAIMAIGGFDEALGRLRNNLHGEEDLAIQRRLRGNGVGAYAARARVKHFIPLSRANWHWLLKRFAWQGFSEVGQTGHLERFHRDALAAATTHPQIAQLYECLMLEPATKDEALKRLNFVRAMLGGLFHGQHQELKVDNLYSGRAAAREGVVLTEHGQPAIRPIAGSWPVFVEFGKSHSYLMDAYGDIAGAKFINPGLDGWRESDKGAAFLRSLRSTIQTHAWRPFFLTLDWMLRASGAVAELCKIGGAGILHRTFDDDPKAIDALRRLAPFVQITCYSPATAAWLESVTGRPCITIRHPPLLFKNVPPNEVRVRRDEKRASTPSRPIVVSLIGEVRPGKGFEYVLRELSCHREVAANVRLCLAGGASNEKVKELRSQVEKSRLQCEFDIRPRSRLDHRGISDVEFAKIMQQTDIMLFPYSGREADSMSGHLVDAVFSGCRVICSVESAMASIVEKWSLGQQYAGQGHGALAHAIAREADKVVFANSENDLLDHFAETFSASAVNQELISIMRK